MISDKDGNHGGSIQAGLPMDRPFRQDSLDHPTQHEIVDHQSAYMKMNKLCQMNSL